MFYLGSSFCLRRFKADFSYLKAIYPRGWAENECIRHGIRYWCCQCLKALPIMLQKMLLFRETPSFLPRSHLWEHAPNREYLEKELEKPFKKLCPISDLWSASVDISSSSHSHFVAQLCLFLRPRATSRHVWPRPQIPSASGHGRRSPLCLGSEVEHGVQPNTSDHHRNCVSKAQRCLRRQLELPGNTMTIRIRILRNQIWTEDILISVPANQLQNDSGLHEHWQPSRDRAQEEHHGGRGLLVRHEALHTVGAIQTVLDRKEAKQLLNLMSLCEKMHKIHKSRLDELFFDIFAANLLDI